MLSEYHDDSSTSFSHVSSFVHQMNTEKILFARLFKIKKDLRKSNNITISNGMHLWHWIS